MAYAIIRLLARKYLELEPIGFRQNDEFKFTVFPCKMHTFNIYFGIAGRCAKCYIAS